ncbi:MAG: lysophospholipid acyltransferase family protein [Actinomycetota bacterium]|nr:lysophospholipid acyltransferase family protein [Actinomycetota bacterium]
MGPSAASRRFYRVARIIVSAWMRVWFRIEVQGAEHVPISGGFVLAPGAHRSILDTPIVCAVSPRMLRYMGAEKYFAVPGLGWFLRSVGGFPVEREMTDRQALRISEAVLTGGEPLVIFAESTRGSGPLVGDLKEGAAFLAARVGVPIVPVGIGGAERAMAVGARFIRPSKIVLVIGAPLQPPARVEGGRAKRSEVKALTATLQPTLQELFDQAQIRAGL